MKQKKMLISSTSNSTQPLTHSINLQTLESGRNLKIVKLNSKLTSFSLPKNSSAQIVGKPIRIPDQVSKKVRIIKSNPVGTPIKVQGRTIGQSKCIAVVKVGVSSAPQPIVIKAADPKIGLKHVNGVAKHALPSVVKVKPKVCYVQAKAESETKYRTESESNGPPRLSVSTTTDAVAPGILQLKSEPSSSKSTGTRSSSPVTPNSSNSSETGRSMSLVEILKDANGVSDHDDIGTHCNQCNKDFDSVDAKMKHFCQWHRRCNQCDIEFSSQAALRIHMASHVPKDKQRKFKCGKCNKRFFLKFHLSTHACIADLTCPVCKKLHARPCDLRKHMLVHTSGKPFQCHICPKKFRHEKTLRKHLRLHDTTHESSNKTGNYEEDVDHALGRDDS